MFQLFYKKFHLFQSRKEWGFYCLNAFAGTGGLSRQKKRAGFYTGPLKEKS